MQTFVADGEVVTFTAPMGGVVAGTPLLIGSLLVIPSFSAAAAASFEGVARGVFAGVKVPTEAWTEGLKIYWDAAAGRFTSVAGSSPANTLVGAATAAVAAAVALATGAGGSPGNLSISDNVLTVVDYSTLASATITVTLARDGADPMVFVLTEGVDFDADTDNATTATNIAAAIDALAGVSAEYVQIPGSPATDTVEVTADNPVPGHVRLDGAAR